MVFFGKVNLVGDTLDINYPIELVYDDYFESINTIGYDKSKTQIPLETSRGCYWQKCKFCG